jgi:hypothetical protein
MEDTIWQNKDTITNIIKSKFKEKMWCDKDLEEKEKENRRSKLSMCFDKCKEKNKHC